MVSGNVSEPAHWPRVISSDSSLAYREHVYLLVSSQSMCTDNQRTRGYLCRNCVQIRSFVTSNQRKMIWESQEHAYPSIVG